MFYWCVRLLMEWLMSDLVADGGCEQDNLISTHL
jgi:hypothetical protein